MNGYPLADLERENMGWVNVGTDHDTARTGAWVGGCGRRARKQETLEVNALLSVLFTVIDGVLLYLVIWKEGKE